MKIWAGKLFEKIKSFFNGLRNKPEEIRRRWLWIFVIISMLIIIGIWLGVTDTFSSIATVTPTPSPENIAKEDSEFVGTLKSGWENTTKNFGKAFKSSAQSISDFLAQFFSGILKGVKGISK